MEEPFRMKDKVAGIQIGGIIIVLKLDLLNGHIG